MKAYLRKLPGGLFRPESDEDLEAMRTIGVGDVISVEFKRPRNYKFHKKFFAMLQVGFDAWEPEEREYKGLPVQKEFNRFRQDVIIAAGFYDVVVNIQGEVRAVAKSISFGAMSEEEFGKLYNAVANVLLQKVLQNYTEADLESVVQDLMGFANG